MNRWLGDWVKQNYPDVKGDLFSCFMVRNSDLGNDHAQMGFMTPYVWMFISTYEKLRKFVIEKNTITSLIQLEYSGFAGATVPICTFTLQKGCMHGYQGSYIRLSDFVGAAQQAPRVLEALANPECGWMYELKAELFSNIPGSPIVYWFKEAFYSSFLNGKSLASVAKPRVGLQTSNNDKFLRLWFESSVENTFFNCTSAQESFLSHKKWYPHNKGGAFARWFGNAEYVINYQANGADLSASPGASKIPDTLSFHRAITYSRISSGIISFRMQPEGMLFDSAAVALHPSSELFEYLLALLNTSLVTKYAEALVPTLNAQPGDIAKIPVVIHDESIECVTQIVNENINAAAKDWNSFEGSWDFKRHPLV